MFNNRRFVLWHIFSQSLEYSIQFRRVSSCAHLTAASASITLNRLSIHVGDDVLRHHFGGLAIGRPGIARDPPEQWHVAKRPQDRISIPHLVVPLIFGSAVGVALL